MGKKIAEGVGTVFGWVIGLVVLWGLWWLTALMVRWSYLYEWVSWTVIITIWIALYAWWYNSYRKRYYRNNAATLYQLLDEMRDISTEVDDELNYRGIHR